tara:strand:+ start:162 stop:317 length:156 start_codon:yes stop_codon:yes gene_type:complete
MRNIPVAAGLIRQLDHLLSHHWTSEVPAFSLGESLALYPRDETSARDGLGE